ncbi:hypothetical protein DM860_013580 [Cuscuta australis]|uniref:Uncharacterized protein n=1 Tax=Cuscuta australis TaxID=267555 RepID=A0A328EA96_9ASTE|nr:hypothetical protein DM860_013580 [Cuscuta australis]
MPCRWSSCSCAPAHRTPRFPRLSIVIVPSWFPTLILYWSVISRWSTHNKGLGMCRTGKASGKPPCTGRERERRVSRGDDVKLNIPSYCVHKCYDGPPNCWCCFLDQCYPTKEDCEDFCPKPPKSELN